MNIRFWIYLQTKVEIQIPISTSFFRVWIVVICVCSSAETFAAWSSTSSITSSYKIKTHHQFITYKILITKQFGNSIMYRGIHRSYESVKFSCTVSTPPSSKSSTTSRNKNISICNVIHNQLIYLSSSSSIRRKREGEGKEKYLKKPIHLILFYFKLQW